ncbi:MAG: DUF262 domain-containing HNH endonuclease family protein [Candidatus Nanoarchaeia archaeon]|jgi:uncharacterized protein with ParB-like and HNH nuclease domain
MGINGFEALSIEELFERVKMIQVPIFQRPYSWNKNEFDQFLEDLDNLKRNEEKTYFIGPIFLKTDGKRSLIIDGQQRLSTATILICLIRDIIFSLEMDDEICSKIDIKYIKDEDLMSSKPYYKLELNEINRDFFKKIQAKGKPEEKIAKFEEEKENDSNKLINACYKSYFNELSKKVKGLNKDETKKFLIRLLQNFLKSFYVLSIRIDDLSEAYTIFETLNDRGLDLTVADLLKNYLFSLLHNKIDDKEIKVYLKQWDQMIANIGNQITSFFKHYMASSKKLIHEKHIYKELKKEITDEHDAEDFLKKIFIQAEVYNQLINPEETYWGNKEIVSLINDIKTLGISLCFPLILSSKDKLSSQIKDILSYCINLSFKYSTICSLHTGKIERNYSDIAIKVRKGILTNKKDIKNQLKRLEPDDEIYNNSFRNLKFKSTNTPKYILIKINNYLDSANEIIAHEKVTLEHIIPKKPKKWEEWLKKNKLIHEDEVYRLANMTILGEEYNRKASGELFNEKLKIYKKSKLPINKELKNFNEWNKKVINEWIEFLLSKSKEIWKI